MENLCNSSWSVLERSCFPLDTQVRNQFLSCKHQTRGIASFSYGLFSTKNANYRLVWSSHLSEIECATKRKKQVPALCADQMSYCMLWLCRFLVAMESRVPGTRGPEWEKIFHAQAQSFSCTQINLVCMVQIKAVWDSLFWFAIWWTNGI